MACIYIYIHIARISMANVSYRFHFNMFHCLTRCTTITTINNRTRQADHVDVEIESVTLNNLMIRGAFGDPAVESLKKFVVFGELYPKTSNSPLRRDCPEMVWRASLPHDS